ncbi:Nn.00g011260.m01.CDS01 [Neocucurbitaria sp. VM-36]
MSDEGEDIEDVPLKPEDEENAKGDGSDNDSDEEDDDYEVSSTSSDTSSSWEDSDSMQSTDSDLPTGNIQDVPIPPPEPEIELEETWSQASDLLVWDGFDAYSTTDDTASMYDPTTLPPENIQWIDRCRCIAFNAKASGITKVFISGRGRYDDYGSFQIKKPGNDLNDTGSDNHTCFYTYDNNDDPAFPFHEACFKILAKTLGHADPTLVNKDVLYAVMCQNIEDYDRVLDLDYGLVQPHEQFWECLPGEEYTVCDPGRRAGFEEVLQSMIPASVFCNTPLDLAHKVRKDPLAVLPYDVLHGIIDHVSVQDMTSLMTASWHVLSTTRETTFWKYMLRRHISPWFWELNTILTEMELHDTLDYKALFLWSNKLTTPEFGLRGPLMGVANRRRIWNACRPLVSLYREKVGPIHCSEPEDEEAKAILDSAVSLHMPIVAYPQPKDVATTSVQFIRSWHEVAHQSCDFDTYWAQSGALVGVAVTFGTNQRVFGSTEGKAGQSLHIESGEWISEIVVYVSAVEMINERVDRSQWRNAMDVRSTEDAEIKGMSVTLTSGRTKKVRSRWNARDQRPFIVLPHMHLIGLTGQIAANGVISRLGLLQASRPGETPSSTLPSYTPAQQRLWSSNAAALPCNEQQTRKPIWNHPNYNLHTFPTSSYDSGDIPFDMLPNQVLLWAESPSLYQYLARISCFQVVGGQVQGGSNSKPRDVPDILGIWPGKTFIHGKAAHVGTGGPVPAQSPLFASCANPSELDLHSKFHAFEEANMSHFAVDGANGEIVTEVHVSDDVKAMKLVTNWGRECYWGEGERGEWHVKRAGEGEVIVGLSCAFGRLSGWSWSAKMYSHWKLSGVGVVTMREGE